MNTQLQKTLQALPQTPGVYHMLNEEEDILYIGKAKNLSKRVRSYFQKNKGHSPWKIKMIEQIQDIKYIETHTEVEALVLETNLIKQHQPKYNILMKDGKNYVYIKITNEDFPQIYLVRKRLKDNARYFGPKTSATETKKTLKFLNRLFPYRMCNLGIDITDPKLEGTGNKKGVKITGNSRKTPCLDYHIKRCVGPCINVVTRNAYQEIVEQIALFLEGKKGEIIKNLKNKMMKAAQEKKFEIAAKIRDQVQSIERTEETFLVADATMENRDIIGYHQVENKIFITLFQMRDGKIINREEFTLTGETDQVSEILESFIQSFYPDTTSIPKEILLPEEIQDIQLLEDFLQSIANKKIKLLIPQRGKKNHLIELANKNAKAYAKASLAKWQEEKPDYKKILEDLQKTLKLDTFPKRMECYDISHLAGTETVGSMVVFQNGEPKNEDYRRFKIQTLKKGKIDDFQSMAEVLERRLLRIKDKLSENISLSKALKKDQDKLQELFPQLIEEKEVILKPKKKKEKSKEEDDKKTETVQKKIQKIFPYKEFFILKENNEPIATARIVKYMQEDKNIFTLQNIWIEEGFPEEKTLWNLMKEIFQKYKGKEIYTFTSDQNKDIFLSFGFREITKTIPKIIEKNIKSLSEQNQIPKENIHIVKYKVPKGSDSFAQIPDLIIIDGGKGQLSSVVKVLARHKLKLNIVSIAKREEELFLPGEKDSIKLQKNNPALHIIQRIRDEAHRFAITFNKNLRGKSAVKSKLDEISGVGPKAKKKLLDTFGSVGGIRKASVEELAQTLGSKLAKKVKENIG